jgi:succinate dehydrogenase flavin-adding protein (antitoxin of CptAB toxin-antitoxin module)
LSVAERIFLIEEHEQLLSLIALDDNDLWEIIAGRSDVFPAGADAMVADAATDTHHALT